MIESEELVSVVIVTYNHEEFISQAIESVLSQECTFRVELLIAEDCSTDNTKSIALKYAEEYPDLIKVLEREKNLGPTRNGYDAYIKCSGKYIATLDGDDYWTDVKKLQKQYDFLEQNKKYVGVTHLHGEVDQNGEKVMSTGWQGRSGEYTIDEFRKGNIEIGHSSTFFIKNIFKEDREKYKIIYQAHDYMGDITLSFVLLMQGPVYCMEEKMSVLRGRLVEGGTNWGSVSRTRDMEYESIEYSMRLLQWEKKYYGLTDSSINRMHKNVYLALAYSKTHPGEKGKKLLKDAFKQDVKKLRIIPFFINMRKNKIKKLSKENHERD